MKLKLYYAFLLFFLGIGAASGQAPGQAKVTYEIPYHNEIGGSYCTEYKVEINYERGFGESQTEWVEIGNGSWTEGRHVLRGEAIVDANRVINAFRFYAHRSYARRRCSDTRVSDEDVVYGFFKCGSFEFDLPRLTRGNNIGNGHRALGVTGKAKVTITPTIELNFKDENLRKEEVQYACVRTDDGPSIEFNTNLGDVFSRSYYFFNGTVGGERIDDEDFFVLQYSYRYDTRGEPIWNSLKGLRGTEKRVSYKNIFIGTDAYFQNLNKPILFRVKPECDGSKPSNILRVVFNLPSPVNSTFTPSYTPPKCNGDVSKDLTFYFSHHLLSGQALDIQIQALVLDDGINKTYETYAEVNNIQQLELTEINNGRERISYTYRPAIEANNLPAGKYRAIYQSSGSLPFCDNGRLVNEFEIDPTPPLKIEGYDIEKVSCQNGGDGEIEVNLSGVQGELFYKIDEGEWISFNSNEASPFRLLTVSNLEQGDHRLRIKDGNDCTDKETPQLNFEIEEVPPITHVIDFSRSKLITDTSRGRRGAYIVIDEVQGGTPLTSNRGDHISYSIGRYTDPSEEIRFSRRMTGLVSGFSISDIVAGKYKIRYSDANNCEYILDLPEIFKPDPITFDFEFEEAAQRYCIGQSSKLVIKNLRGATRFDISLVRNRVINGRVTEFLVDSLNNVRPSNEIVLAYNRRGNYTVKVESLDSEDKKQQTFFVNQLPRLEEPIVNVEAYFYCDDRIKYTVIPNQDNVLKGIHEYGVYSDILGETKWQQSPDFILDYSQSEPVTFSIRDSEYPCTTSNFTTVHTPKQKLEFNITVDKSNICTDANAIVNIAPIRGAEYAVYKTNESEIIWQTSNTFTLAVSDEAYRFLMRKGNCEEISEPVDIQSPSGFEISYTTIDNTIRGGLQGAIEFNIGGDALPFHPNGEHKVTLYRENTNGSFRFLNTIRLDPNNAVIDGLSAGNYRAIFFGGDSCTFNVENIEIKQPEIFKAEFNSEEFATVSCANDTSKPNLKVVATGGSEQYTYAWYRDNVLLPNETGNSLNIGAGRYHVEVNDGINRPITLSKNYRKRNPLPFSVLKEDIFSCNGSSSGAIIISAVNTATTENRITVFYEYSIDNQETFIRMDRGRRGLYRAVIPVETAGEYTVWVRDHFGCIESRDVTVEEFPPIELENLKINHATQYTNGSITYDGVKGGQGGPYLFRWSGRGRHTITNEQNLSNLTAGLYKLSISDNRGSNSCRFEQDFEIEEPERLRANIKITKPISCSDSNDGEIAVEITGGFIPDQGSPVYRYTWQKSDLNGRSRRNLNKNQSVIDSLGPGRYDLSVIDEGGRRAIVSHTFITMQPPAPLEIKFSRFNKNVSCFNRSDGEIKIDEITGGTPPYTYEWSKKEDPSFTSVDKDIYNVPTGIYVVEVTDAKGCRLTSNEIYIKEPEEMQIFSSIKDVSSFGKADGFVRVSTYPRISAFTSSNYEWRKKGDDSIIGSSLNLDNIEAGIYQFTFKLGQCSITEEFEVKQPEELKITNIEQFGEVLCFNNSDTVRVLARVEGGEPPYTYEWKKSGAAGIISRTNEAENITRGLYSFTVTDKNGTVTRQSYTVNAPRPIRIDFEGKFFLCHGEEDGVIQLRSTGGTPPYTYRWQHTTENTNELSGLATGIYAVTVTDRNFCENILRLRISESPSSLVIKSHDITNVTKSGLADGAVGIEVEGGWSSQFRPYRYEWTDETGAILENSTAFLSNVKGGIYTVTVTDYNNCTVSETYEILEPQLPEFSLNGGAVLCHGSVTTLNANIQGKIDPTDQYTWRLKESATVLSTTTELNNVGAGVYVFTISDENGNENSKEYNLLQPAVLEINATNTAHVSCYGASGGSLDITVGGGTAPYSYKWDHTNSDSNVVTNLLAGNYTVEITDANGCVLQKTFTITEPELYVISNVRLERPVSSASNDGNIEVIIQGGSAPYNYLWEDGLGNVVQNETSNTNNHKIDNLSPGSYAITVTDSNGCSIDAVYNLANPGQLLVEIEQQQDVLCYNGSNGVLDVVTIGGAGGNTYVWYNAVSKEIVGRTKLLRNVSQGSYFVVVSNAEGIEEKSSIFKVEQPETIAVDINTIDITCFGAKNGVFNVKMTGGSENYEYRYANSGDYTNWTKVIDGLVTVDNLEKGNYRIQVRDSNNCTALDLTGNSEFIVSILEPDVLEVIESKITNTTGFERSNGAIYARLQGGTPEYNYQWFDANGTIIATGVNTITNISAGSYKLIVEDRMGCHIEKDYEVSAPDRLEVSIRQLSIIRCSGTSNGALKAVVKGGLESSYTYSWYMEGSSTVLGTESNLNNLDAGAYYVTVEDANSNKARSATFELTAPSVLNISITSNYISCGTGKDWSVNAVVTGGRAPYAYLWNTNANTPTIANVVTGFYEVTVIDASGCRSTKNIELSPPKELSILNEEIKNPVCFGGDSGRIFVEVSGGVSPYTYNWSNGNTSGLNEGLKAGIYNLEIIDRKGCKIYRTYTLTGSEDDELNLGEDVTLCLDQTTVLNATTTNAVSYKWSSSNGFSSTEPIIEVSKAGVYAVVVVNSEGCVMEDEIVIKTSTDEISGDFLVSAIAFVNEPLVAVYLNSAASDEAIWLFPDTAIVNKTDENYLEVYFKEVGEYEITLYTKKGKCEAYKTKTVFVTEKDISDTSNETEVDDNERSSIKEFKIYPNPTSGKFSLSLNLYNEKEVSVKIFNLVDNEIKDHRRLDSKEEHIIDYDLDVSAGVYFVLVEIGNEKLLKKVIIGK